MAKAEREAQRKAEKAERDRVKEEEKAARAAAREAEFAARRKQKEDAKKARQRELKYPIDDDTLRTELLAEAAEKGIKPEELTPHPYRELPKPTPIADGALVADEAALADFFEVFGETLGVSATLNTAEGVRKVIVGCGKELMDLYGCLLRPTLEVSVVGKSRNAARWKRILSVPRGGGCGRCSSARNAVRPAWKPWAARGVTPPRRAHPRSLPLTSSIVSSTRSSP